MICRQPLPFPSRALQQFFSRVLDVQAPQVTVEDAEAAVELPVVLLLQVYHPLVLKA